jgi:hypothetical protein
MSILVRRTLVVLVLFAGSTALLVHTARAQLEQALLSGTECMFALPPAWLHGAPRRVHVNGATVRIMTGRSDLALSALLDHAESLCRAHGGGLERLVARAHSKMRATAPRGHGSVLRAENAQEGVVACLDLGSEQLSMAEFARKLERFSVALDLAELGGVRLVRARALSYGAFFVVAESEGPVPLSAMFPLEGDAPGLDSPDAPRPPGTRRVLAAWQEQGEPALFVYQSHQRVDELWAEYVRELGARGYVPSSLEHAQSAREHAELFAREGHSLLVVFTPEERGTEALIMPLDAGPGSIAVR